MWLLGEGPRALAAWGLHCSPGRAEATWFPRLHTTLSTVFAPSVSHPSHLGVLAAGACAELLWPKRGASVVGLLGGGHFELRHFSPQDSIF